MHFNKLIPELYCSDFKRTLDFYTKVAGFQVRYARPEERFAFLERDGAQIMIEQPTDPARTWLAGALVHPYGRGINLQIEVADIAAVHGSVRAAGAPLFVALEDKWYRRHDVLLGSRQFVAQDPDGYLLRFFQDLGVRPVPNEARRQP
jgi:catechol 2,3-dioxygenase-like lactoylglutathione lyase family enzyme